MPHDLSRKTVLVTGASRGLGAAIARKLAGAGARTAVNYFASADRAQKLVAQIESDGKTAKAFRADVRDEQQIRQMVFDIEATLGPIDILVINATGPQPFVRVEDLTWRHCLDQLEFFVKSPLLLAQAVLPHMKRQRSGRIIQIGTEAFERGVPEFSNYVSAKGAQLGLTRSWAMELAKHNITVNLVAPGWVPTERHANDPQEARDAYTVNVPLKRMGTPDEIASAVLFLASDEAAFITGQKLSVNGGHTLA